MKSQSPWKIPMNTHAKQIKAINLAIEALKRERRKLYAAGEAAYNQGMRTDVINTNGTTGELFAFAEDGHKGYTEYTDSIQELEDLKDILLDPGVTKDQIEMFPV